MKVVVAFQTCERLHFLKKCIDSVMEHNPSFLIDGFVIVADDNSQDGGATREYIKSLPFVDYTIFNNSRLGIHATIKKIAEASLDNGEVLLYIQNDQLNTRFINIEYVEKFLNEHEEVGQIKVLRWKGAQGVNEREIGPVDVYKKKTEVFDRFVIGTEVFMTGSWSYSDPPCFLRTEALPSLFTKKIADVRKKYQSKKFILEIVRAMGFYEAGWACSMLENTAFWSQIGVVRQSTPRKKD